MDNAEWLVQIYANDTDGDKCIGTGYSIGGGLVITARHVVLADDRADDPKLKLVWVGQNKHKESFTDKDIIYDGGKDNDIAVIRCPQSLPFNPPTVGLYYSNPKANLHWSSRGYLRAGKEGKTRTDKGVPGIIAGFKDSIIELTAGIDVTREDGWGGLSGAPVFIDGTKLVAIITDRYTTIKKYLESVSIPFMLKNPDFCKAIKYKVPYKKESRSLDGQSQQDKLETGATSESGQGALRGVQSTARSQYLPSQANLLNKESIADKVRNNKEYNRFKIAFSFAGDDIRGYVKSVAEFLVKEYKFNEEDIFYDEWYKSKLSIANLDDELKEIYSNQTELIVPVFTKGYKKTEWCKIEWKEISKIIKSNKHSVLLVKRGSVGIKSLNWNKKDGYIDCTNLSVSELAKHIVDRINSNALATGNSISNKEISLSFSDHNKELEEILNGNRQFHLIRALFSYGRTAIINKLEEKYNKKGWIVKKSTNLGSFQQNDITKDLTNNTYKNFEEFVRSIQILWNKSEGLAILIDLPRSARLDAPELILSNFFDIIKIRFSDLGISLDCSNSRLIIATHRLDANINRFNSILLSEFTYDAVNKLATNYLKKNNLIPKNVNTDCITAKLFYATGGYPNSVRQYLKNFPDNIKNTTSNIETAENNFANSISAQSRILFHESNIMCYRYLDRTLIGKIRPKTLKGIKISNIISTLLRNDGYHTFEVSRNALLTSSQIICPTLMRRVYAVIYREKDKNKFIDACKEASKLYLEYVKTSHIDKKFSFLWLKEYWFQSLQSAQVSNSLPLDPKDTINSLFLFLNQLSDEYSHYYPVLIQQLEEDWEFQFLINFRSFEIDKCYNPNKFTEFMEFIEEQYQDYHQRQST